MRGGRARVVGAALVALALALPAVVAAQDAHGGGTTGAHGHAGPAEETGHGAHGALGCAEVWGRTPFVAKVVNFGLLLAVLGLAVRRPAKSYLRERRIAVEENLAEAQRLKKEAESKYQEYADRLQKLDQELERLRHDMVKAGEAERDRIVKEAEHKAARMRRDTEFVIEQQMKQLRADLTQEAVENAIVTAEKVLREQVTAEDQKRLADNYLEQLRESAGHGASASGSNRQERAS